VINKKKQIGKRGKEKRAHLPHCRLYAWQKKRVRGGDLLMRPSENKKKGGKGRRVGGRNPPSKREPKPPLQRGPKGGRKRGRRLTITVVGSGLKGKNPFQGVSGGGRNTRSFETKHDPGGFPGHKGMKTGERPREGVAKFDVRMGLAFALAEPKLVGNWTAEKKSKEGVRSTDQTVTRFGS